MSSQMFWGTDRSRAKIDLKFTEIISQRMQVPSRLQIVEESAAARDGVAKDDHPASFQMHIPDRISLAGVEMMEDGLRPFQMEQLQWKPPTFTSISLGRSPRAPRSSECPFIKKAVKFRYLKPNSLNRSQNIQTTDASSDARGTITQHTGRASMEDDGFYRTSALEKLPLSTPPQLSTLDLHRNTSDKPVEDLGLTEVIAMRKLLINISGRLQSLEEERDGSYKKELLIYSALLTACLINTLLWLRR